jgi:autotransporter-associated beta strand protein
LTLSGANTTTGALTINGGSVVVSAGGTLGAQALTFGAANTGGGLFNFNSASTASALTQTLGALSFLGGDGVVQSTYTTGATSSTLTFGSLVARTLGASGLFVSSGGTNGTSNNLKFTTFTTPGSFIGGAAAGVSTSTGATYFFNTGGASDFAWYDTTGFVRAPVYGTDTGATTVAASATLSASSVNQITTTSGATGTVTQGANVAVNGIKFTGASTALSISSTFTVTAPSILVTGGTVVTPNTATISGAGTLVGLTSSDIIIRTDSAYDSLTINSIIGQATKTYLTKTGAGTLTIGSGVNAFSGDIFINQGVFAFTTSYNSIDTNTSLGASGAVSYTHLRAHETN